MMRKKRRPDISAAAVYRSLVEAEAAARRERLNKWGDVKTPLRRKKPLRRKTKSQAT